MQVKKIKKIKTTLKSKDYKECFHIRRFQYLVIKKNQKKAKMQAHMIFY